MNPPAAPHRRGRHPASGPGSPVSGSLSLPPASHLRGQVAVERTSSSARNLRGQVAVERTPSAASHLRGQVAAEFMLYTGVFIFIAIVAFVVVTSLQNTEVPLQQNGLVKETGDGFVNALTLAVKGGEGFSYNYTFPKTIYGLPYSVNFNNLDEQNASILIEWNGSYGAFSYQYALPSYNYRVSGGCLGGQVMASNACSNVLMLNNDGENLTITQLP